MKHVKRTNKWAALPLVLLLAAGARAEQTLTEVTVSGQVPELEEQRTAVTQKIILDRQAIAATGGLTVGEVLGKLPGVDAGIPGSDGMSSLRARGMVRESVQVLVDGERPSGSSRFALQIISRMPAGELERVEIMKGATAEFGGAVPLTINLITSRARRQDSLELKAVAGARGDQPLARLSLTRTGGQGAWSWSLPLSLSQNRTPLEQSRERRDAAGGLASRWQEEQERGRNVYSEQYFAPKLNWKEGQSSFSIWPSLFRAQGDRDLRLSRAQSPDPALGAALLPVPGRDDQEAVRYRINRLRLEGETRAGGNKLSARLGMLDGHKDSDIVRRGSGGPERESYRRQEREVNGALRLDRAWAARLFSLGLEFSRLRRQEAQDYSGSDAGQANYRARERQTSLWLQDEWGASPALTLTSGLRAEWIGLESDGEARSHQGLYPSLAARWELQEGWQLRLAAGGAIKAPRLDEISGAPVRSSSANSPLEPDQRGNPELRPERSASLDLALEHYWPGDQAYLSLGSYFRRTRDFIERRPGLENGRWVERPYNEGEARHWGLELEGKLKTGFLGLAGGGLRLHLTLPQARVDDRRLGVERDARELPRYVWSLGYDQPLPALSSSAGFQWQRTGPTRSRIPGEFQADTRGRSSVDAYWVRRLDKTVNLRLTLQNLLGEDLRRVSRYQTEGLSWQLQNRQDQSRVLMLALEGKW